MRPDLDHYTIAVALWFGTTAAAMMMIVLLFFLIFVPVSVPVAFVLLILAYAAGVVCGLRKAG